MNHQKNDNDDNNDNNNGKRISVVLVIFFFCELSLLRRKYSPVSHFSCSLVDLKDPESIEQKPSNDSKPSQIEVDPNDEGQSQSLSMGSSSARRQAARDVVMKKNDRTVAFDSRTKDVQSIIDQCGSKDAAIARLMRESKELKQENKELKESMKPCFSCIIM